MEKNRYKTYKVLKIYDGDTTLVKNDRGEEASVRFSYIDCFETKKNSSIHTYLPESNILDSQYKWGELSKDDLFKMVMLNNYYIKLNIIDYDDFYKRYIAEVYDDFDNLYQIFSIKKGTSFILKGDLYKFNHDLLVDLIKNTEIARHNLLHAWGDYYAISPYLFRKFKKGIEDYIKQKKYLTPIEELKYDLYRKNKQVEDYLLSTELSTKLDYNFQLSTVSLIEDLFESN